MNVSEPFIRQPVMTVLLVVSAALFGVLTYRELPVNDLPGVDYPVIQVQVGYPGATPETMANNVATPLERQFMQIPGLSLVTSSSSQGFANLILQFDLSKSVDAAATDVQAAITRATRQLPLDLPSPPTFVKVNPNDQPIIYIGLTSDSVTSGQLYDYAKTQVGQRINILPGVSQVGVFGAQSAVRIKADTSATAVRGLTIDDLNRAIQNNTSYQGAGQLDGEHHTLLLQPQGQLDSVRDYENLIVAAPNGAPLYLKDVAKVYDSLVDERMKTRFWVRGQSVPSATVVLAVFRQVGSNAVEVAQSVKDLLPVIRAELPGSVQIMPIYDRSKNIVNNINDVKQTLVIAFFLVVFVIFLFLGRATDTLIPALAMPLSLLMVFIAMRLLGYSLDNLSLMGLTLTVGFLVDDAIVFLENTVRRMEQFGEGVIEATLKSANEISFTIVAMTISLAAVFIPLVFMRGLIGRIFREFSITVIIAILASGVVSLTLTPMMCSRMLGGRGEGTKKTAMERIAGKILRKVLDVYGVSLWWFLRNRWVSAMIWVICMAGTVWLFKHVPQAFLPIGDSSFIRGVIIAQEGSSPNQMQAYQAEVEKAVHANPAVEMTVTATNRGPFLASNQGFVLAILKDPGEREPIQQVAGRLMADIRNNVPGIFAILQPNPVLSISTGATATQQGQYAYAISGIDPDMVYDVAGKLMAGFSQFKGFATVSSDLFNHTPLLEIEILREQAKSYGISSSRILGLLQNAYSENYVYQIKRPSDQYQVIIEARDIDRGEPEDLSLLYIRSDDGQRTVPLSAVATWHQILGMQAVHHINQFTSVTFFFNLRPGTSLGEAADFIEKTASEVLPTTVQGALQGDALTFRNTMRGLVVLMFMAIFVMYVILGILYESYLHPVTVLSSLPVALVGGLATLYIFGEEASLYAFIGMFMLMGIVKKNGIMIVDFALARIDEGKSAEEAIHQASMDRFRPIVMTTLAAMMGALPIALGYGADGASRRPLGLVVVGGLLVSQFITLYITPAIYLYLEEFQEKVLNKTSFFRASHGTAGASVVCIMLLLASWGCTVGPNYKPPQTETPAEWGEMNSSVVEAQPVQLADWWKKFNDPVLDKLVEQAISSNLNLQQAELRLQEARAQRGVVVAGQWPTVNAAGSYQHIHNSQSAAAGGAPGGQNDSNTVGVSGRGNVSPLNLYQAGFDASWELDVFGGVRRSVEAANANVSAALEDRRDVLVSLLAEVAINYIELRSFQRQLVVAKENLKVQTDTLELTRRRFEAGTVTSLDIAQAEAQVSTTSAQIPALDASAHQAMHQISVLLGENPMAMSELLTQDMPIPEGPPKIPVGLPSDILRQRADIRRAESRLAAATALIGVATADLFPRFSLTGEVGRQSTSFKGLGNSDNNFWFVGPGVNWPVFDAGRIGYNIKAQNARQEQALTTYKQTVLTALQEVEDALVAYASEQVRRKNLADAVKANREAVKLSNQLYTLGRTDFLNVLNTQRSLHLAEVVLVQSDLALSTDIVAIYKALGGGWEGLEYQDKTKQDSTK